MLWLAQSGEFFELSMGGRISQLHAQALKFDGLVLSMRITSEGTVIAVRRDSGVWIVTPYCTVIDSIPAEAFGAVLLLDAGAAYVSGTDVVVRNGDGSEARFAVPSAPQALFRMGANWVEIVTTAANYALRINPGLGTPVAVNPAAADLAAPNTARQSIFCCRVQPPGSKSHDQGGHDLAHRRS